MRERFLGAALLFGLAAGCATTPRPVAKTQLPGCPPAWVSSPDDAYAAAFRSRIGTVWDPEISHRAARYHGEYSDRYTILIADIRPDGGLAAVHVEQRSGIGSFDDAVMAAMRRAEPFPAPPPSLVGSEDFVRIRFGIYLGAGAFGPGTCGAPAAGVGPAPTQNPGSAPAPSPGPSPTTNPGPAPVPTPAPNATPDGR
jgi:TonB family protein